MVGTEYGYGKDGGERWECLTFLMRSKVRKRVLKQKAMGIQGRRRVQDRREGLDWRSAEGKWR